MAGDWWEGPLRDYPIIVSAPMTFFWAGEHTVLVGKKAVCMSVPLRVYVGVRQDRRANGSILLQDGEVRDSWGGGKRRYEWPSGEGVCKEKVEELLKMDFYCGGGVFVKYCSDLPPGVGCDWSGAFSRALVRALWKVTRPRPGRVRSNLAWRVESVLHGFWDKEKGYYVGAASGYGVNKPDDKPWYTYWPNVNIIKHQGKRFPEFSYTGAGYAIDEMCWEGSLSPYEGLEIGLVDSGVTKYTGEEIRKRIDEGFYEPEKIRPLADCVGKVVRWAEAASGGEHPETDDLFDLIRDVETTFEERKFEFPMLVNLRDHLGRHLGHRARWFAMKFTGAGGGGCIAYFCRKDMADEVCRGIDAWASSGSWKTSDDGGRLPSPVWRLKEQGVCTGKLIVERG